MPEFAIVAAARCANNASGMGKRPRSLVGSVFCCTRSRLAPHRCGYAGLEPQRAPARLSATRATSTRRGELVTPRRRFATSSRYDPFPRAAGARSPFVGGTARSQCAGSNGWPGHDQAVRHPRTLCRFARFGNRNTDVMPPRLPRCPFSSDSCASPSGAL